MIYDLICNILIIIMNFFGSIYNVVRMLVIPKSKRNGIKKYQKKKLRGL